MIVEFLSEAEEELLDAIVWYESKEAGLGKRLRDEIGHVLERIVEDPPPHSFITTTMMHEFDGKKCEQGSAEPRSLHAPSAGKRVGAIP